ncbi:hypothetical protein ACH5RR_008956 [Cinchona calisaya]|uniref:Uncharacterized protein n=1 Tax=Cinchona calisaya TaxID=153742 RepID=A0ABD3AD17_9GENT
MIKNPKLKNPLVDDNGDAAIVPASNPKNKSTTEPENPNPTLAGAQKKFSIKASIPIYALEDSTSIHINQQAAYQPLIDLASGDKQAAHQSIVDLAYAPVDK